MKNNKGIFWKVVFGFAIAAGLLLTTYFITYNNLESLKGNLSLLSKANPKYIYRQNIIKKIDEADSYVKRYVINKDESFALHFDTAVRSIGSMMDELSRLSSDNSEYNEELIRMGLFIKDRISIEDERMELAKEYSLGTEMKELFTEISANESKSVVLAEAKQPDKTNNDNFFSRLFSSKKNREKSSDLNQTKEALPQAKVIPASKVKEIIKRAEKKENDKMAVYLNEMLILMDRDDRVYDSIKAISSTLEKLETQETIRLTNKLTDETTNKTANILSSLILTGVLIMFVFLIIVYFEIKKSEVLRKELIREKQNTEKLAKVKEEFLANMSHEIRTPMNVIMGFSEQLSKTDLNNEQQKLLLNIKRSSNHLITVINEILDYSKIEAGIIALEKIPFEVKEIVDDVYESFKNIASKKGIKLSYKIDDAVAKTVIGDPVRLKQILLNLTGNAVKFTKEGSIQLMCKVWSGDEGAQTLLFEVKDTGVGIPANSQEKIFDQFAQADSSVTRKYGGTGLGLTITKKLIEAQKGEIGVKSEEGKGSVFFFRLTYSIGLESDKEISSKSSDSMNFQVLSGKRILIVDDDDLNKALASYILENYDVDVDTASNGKEAIEKVTEENYDLILMDLNMPGMNGADVVTEIRKKKIDIPVIAITGNVLKPEIEKCMEAGMNGYISKPYDEAALLQEIIDLLLTV